MSKQEKKLQPGVILHDAIMGAFRSSGQSFEQWCKDNDVKPATARTATYGQSGGEKGQALLAQIIDDAGREMVELAYANRMISEAKTIEESREGDEK